ncbi:MAG: hypothetical protein WDZ96_05025 [Acidimicrobiia bacterium]
MDSPSPEAEELFFDAWDTEDDLDTASPPPRWRRPAIVVIAVLVAVSLAILPLQSLFDGTNSPVSESGLEICGYDYCIVREAVTEAGLDLEMSRLANTLLDDSAAADLADELTAYLGVDGVSLTVVDELGGRLGGVYDPTTRSILIERPANAWVVAHEVAHAVAPGHGKEFQDVLIDLSRHMLDD